MIFILACALRFDFDLVQYCDGPNHSITVLAHEYSAPFPFWLHRRTAPSRRPFSVYFIELTLAYFGAVYQVNSLDHHSFHLFSLFT